MTRRPPPDWNPDDVPIAFGVALVVILFVIGFGLLWLAVGR